MSISLQPAWPRRVAAMGDPVVLYRLHRDGRKVPIPWPHHWPKAVSEKFLKQHGYEIRRD